MLFAGWKLKFETTKDFSLLEILMNVQDVSDIVHGVKIWNSIPEQVRNSESLNSLNCEELAI
jgi:hypothetical protein